MDYINQHSLHNPINNPLVLTLLVFVFTLRCYHFLCVCYFVSNLCVSLLGSKYKSTCVLFFLVVVSILLSVCVVLVLMLNVTMLPVLGIINVWTWYCVIGSLLTIYQLWLPVKLIFWVMKLVSCVSGVVHYYKTDIPKVFLASKQQFNSRYLVASLICILIGIASSCGVGFLLVLALVSCRRSQLNLLVLRYAFTIPHTSMPLDDQPITQTKFTYDCDLGMNKTRTTLKHKQNVGKENACQHGDNIPPPKRGRKSKHIGDEHRCGS